MSMLTWSGIVYILILIDEVYVCYVCQMNNSFYIVSQNRISYNEEEENEYKGLIEKNFIYN